MDITEKLKFCEQWGQRRDVQILKQAFKQKKGTLGLKRKKKLL